MLRNFRTVCVGPVLVFAAAAACGNDSGSGQSASPGASSTSANANQPVPAGSAGTMDGASATGAPSVEATPAPSPSNTAESPAIAGVVSGGSASGGAAGEGMAGNASGGSAGAPSAEVPVMGAAGAATTPGAGGFQFPAGVTKPRIMIVGDSISAGPGCYKKYLVQNLTANGYANYEFVGQYNDDCGGGVRHSAVSCSTAEQYAQPTFMMPNCAQGTSFPGMPTLAATHRPDLIMVQLGVNDVWGNRAQDAILASYTQLVREARMQNPNVALVFAQIAKMRPECGTDDSIQKRAEALVNAVPAWAKALSLPESPVFVADLWTNSDWSQAETLDCVHPNDAGAQRMGRNWFEALKNILSHN